MREHRRRRALFSISAACGFGVLFGALLLTASAAVGCAASDTAPPGALFGDRPRDGAAGEEGGEAGRIDGAAPDALDATADGEPGDVGADAGLNEE